MGAGTSERIHSPRSRRKRRRGECLGARQEPGENEREAPAPKQIVHQYHPNPVIPRPLLLVRPQITIHKPPMKILPHQILNLQLNPLQFNLPLHPSIFF